MMWTSSNDAAPFGRNDIALRANIAFGKRGTALAVDEVFHSVSTDYLKEKIIIWFGIGTFTSLYVSSNSLVTPHPPRRSAVPLLPQEKAVLISSFSFVAIGNRNFSFLISHSSFLFFTL